MNAGTDRAAHLFLGAVVLAWGANFGIVKTALEDLHPLVFSALRFTACSALLLGVTLWREGDVRIARRHWPRVAAVGALGVGGYQMLWSLGLHWTYATNSALLFATQPIFGALYMALFKGEALAWREAAGMALALGGAVLVVLRPDARLQLSLGTLPGDLVTLAGCICFPVFFSAWARPLLAAYSPLRLTGQCMVVGSLVLWVGAGLAGGGTAWGGVPGAAWGGLLYAVVISGALGHVFWYEGLGRIGVTRTLVYQFLVPVWAVIFNHLALGERLFPQQLLGGALILWGVHRVLRG